MTISYQWTLDGPNPILCQPEAEGKELVVSAVRWRLDGTDGEYSGTTSGVQAIPFGTVRGFTPFDKLTEAQLIGWAQDAMGTEQVAVKRDAVADQIAVQANPPIVTPPVPWGEPSGIDAMSISSPSSPGQAS